MDSVVWHYEFCCDASTKWLKDQLSLVEEDLLTAYGIADDRIDEHHLLKTPSIQKDNL